MNSHNPQALRGLLRPIADPCDLYAEAAMVNLRWVARCCRPELAPSWRAQASKLHVSRLMRWSSLLGSAEVRAGIRSLHPARRKRFSSSTGQ